MVDVITSKFKKYLIDHCKIKAKEYNTTFDNVQVRFHINADAPQIEDESDHVKYATTKTNTAGGFGFVENNTFIKLLHLKFDLDFLGYSRMIPPFIYKSLQSISGDENIPEDDLYVFVCPYHDDDNHKDELAIHIFKQGDYVKSISLEELVLGHMAESAD